MSSHLTYQTKKFSSTSEFNKHCADIILQYIKDSTNNTTRKTLIGLSGGSTPVPIYQQVRDEIIAQKLSLENVIFFMVDNRYIESTHKDSNIQLVNTSLLTEDVKKSTPVHTVFPDVDGLSLHDCVEDYNTKIKQLIQEHGKADFVTLGLGPDGHTASLFPILSDEVFDTSRDVVYTTTDKFAVRDRLGVNIPFLEDKCDNYAMFLKGKDKGVIWDSMISELGSDKLQGNKFQKDTVKRWPVANLLLKPSFAYLLCEE
jgi:6-phosphogluconolactonase